MLTLLDSITKADAHVRSTYQNLTYDNERVEMIERELQDITPGSDYYRDLQGRHESYLYSQGKTREKFTLGCDSYNKKVRAFQLLMQEKAAQRLLFELRLKGVVESYPWYPE